MSISISISSRIFDELITTVEVIGIDRTIQTLKKAKANSLILGDINIDFVITTVSSVTNLTKERILNGTDRSDDRKIAIALCVYLIKTEFSYTYSQIQNIFNIGISALSRYHTIVEKLPKTPKTEFDKRLIDLLKQINILIIEKKVNDA